MSTSLPRTRPPSRTLTPESGALLRHVGADAVDSRQGDPAANGEGGRDAAASLEVVEAGGAQALQPAVHTGAGDAEAIEEPLILDPTAAARAGRAGPATASDMRRPRAIMPSRSPDRLP
jgi:hypothetical protein